MCRLETLRWEMLCFEPALHSGTHGRFETHNKYYWIVDVFMREVTASLREYTQFLYVTVLSAWEIVHLCYVTVNGRSSTCNLFDFSV